MTTIARPAAAEAPVTARYGVVDALHPNGHSGTDFGWWGGNPTRPIYSPIDGVVTDITWNDGDKNGLGGTITIVGGRFRFQAGHLRRSSSDIGLVEGQTVKAGQHIANYGVPTTGYSTGPHLHANFWVDGVRQDILAWVGQDQEGGSAAPSAPSGWVVGQTDFKGSYGLNELDGARWYVIEPATDNAKTIWAICQQYGVDLGSAAAWSAKVRDSKWGGQLLQAGSSWWDGSGTYYAGVCVALNDVAAILDAREAAAKAAAAAEAEKIKAEEQAAIAIDAADAKVAAELEPKEVPVTDAPDTTEVEKEQAKKELDVALEKAKEKLPEVKANIEELQGNIDPRSAFQGLFDRYPNFRFWMYIVFAAILLLLSLIPDAIQSGVVPQSAIPWLTDWTYFITSISLKLGVAFGFIAASNTSKVSKK